ncbi:MAG: flavin reductase family protein [Gemmatimonadota bacterium]|nr:flavin reductase family protein [Gemmatimonadota bacterium]MDH3422829.1 flavin reductase family protein [Gemmatimonadota bacterium]
MNADGDRYTTLDVSHAIWDRFFWVAPLLVIGTKEPDGSYDLAPKHMATPLGWENYFGFVCTPRHATYRNAIREHAFTVSYPRPDQLVHTSLSAEPRCEDGHKTSIVNLPVIPGEVVAGPLLDGAYVHLECKLDRIVEGFGENGLVIGSIVAARVHEDALRRRAREDQRLIAKHPLLAYLAPGQYAIIDKGQNFPFPSGFAK